MVECYFSATNIICNNTIVYDSILSNLGPLNAGVDPVEKSVDYIMQQLLASVIFPKATGRTVALAPPPIPSTSKTKR